MIESILIGAVIGIVIAIVKVIDISKNPQNKEVWDSYDAAVNKLGNASIKTLGFVSRGLIKGCSSRKGYGGMGIYCMPKPRKKRNKSWI